MGEQGDGVTLHEALARHFSLDELRLLCHDAGIDPETVPYAERGRDLFAFCIVGAFRRKGQIPALLEECARQRPGVNWAACRVETAVPAEWAELFTETAYDVAGLESPYLGLSAFTYAERERYAGRERDVAGALAVLTEPGAQKVLLFVTGASGSGKSSFAQAGLLPALEAHYAERGEALLRLPVVRPGAAPAERLRDALAPLGAARLADLPNRERERPAALVLDQFEEFFTQSDPAQRRAIFDQLVALPPFAQCRLHVIATLRSDYLNELFADRGLWAIAKQGVELREMSRDELKAAIQRPLQSKAEADARYVGKRFEPALVDRLAHQASPEPPDPALLPLLQVTLDELWRKKRRLTLSSYQVTDDGAFVREGVLTDALQRRANDVLTWRDYDAPRPGQQRTEAGRDEVLATLLDLVQVSPDDDGRRDVRVSRRLDALTPERQRMARELAGARLVSIVTDDDGDRDGHGIAWVNIIHESLINSWPTLREAVKEARATLQRRARFEQDLRDWLEHGQSDDYLLRDLALARARELERVSDVALSDPLARDLLQRSVSAAEAEQRQEQERLVQLAEEQRQRAEAEAQRAEIERRSARRARQFVAGLLVVALVALGLAGWAFVQTQRAEAAQAEAQRNLIESQRQQALSRSRELAAVAINQLATNPERALQIALEAECAQHTYESEDALRRAIAAPIPIAVLAGHQGYVYAALFSPDGARIVTAGGDGTARLWDGKSGAPIATLAGHASAVYAARFSPDGARIVTVGSIVIGSTFIFGDDRTARLWDGKSGAPIATLAGHQGRVVAAQFSPDGARIVTAGEDRTARLWDGKSGAPIATLAGHQGYVYAAQFSPDGARIVTASADRTARLWDGKSGASIATLADHEGFVNAAQFSPDGARIVTASDDRTARLWDGKSGAPIATLAGHAGPVQDAQFSPDGARIVTASKDGTARIHWTHIADVIALARQHAPRELTAQERATYLNDAPACPRP